MPDISKLIIQPPEAAYTPSTPPTKTPWANTGALPEDTFLLQEEMNSAMGHLLTTRVSLDACQRKQVSDFETAIHQNDTEASKAIRGTKVHCGSAIREVEACCAADIREVKSHCVGHACTIQQSHSDNMQCLERVAIEEEGKDCQSFLATYRMALQACPPEAQGVLMCPLQMLMGNMSLVTLLAILPWMPTAREESTPVIS